MTSRLEECRGGLWATPLHIPDTNATLNSNTPFSDVTTLIELPQSRCHICLSVALSSSWTLCVIMCMPFVNAGATENNNKPK